jgi:hypothetical protein
VAEKTRCGGLMTESAWLAWIRSALRAKSLRWPPRARAIELSRRAYKGPNKLQKWEVVCRICEKWFKLKEIVVDHFPHAAGSILSVEDIGPFANNLFCEVDNLRTLCKNCHDIHTLAEKQGVSFSEAEIAKKVIESCKLKIPIQLARLSGYGYNDCSNAAKRKAAWHKIHNREKL